MTDAEIISWLHWRSAEPVQNTQIFSRIRVHFHSLSCYKLFHWKQTSFPNLSLCSKSAKFIPSSTFIGKQCTECLPQSLWLCHFLLKWGKKREKKHHFKKTKHLFTFRCKHERLRDPFFQSTGFAIKTQHVNNLWNAVLDDAQGANIQALKGLGTFTARFFKAHVWTCVWKQTLTAFYGVILYKVPMFSLFRFGNRSY